MRADRLARSTQPLNWGLRGGQDVEGDAPVLAGLLEVGHELAAAVDLDGGDREGHDLGHGREEALGVAGGGLGEGPCGHVPGGWADGAGTP